MIAAMFFGMSRSLGRVPPPWDGVANALLLGQFPLLHSLLLSRRGSRMLRWLAPSAVAAPLATTSYVIVASVQVFLLFALWTPSGKPGFGRSGASSVRGIGLLGHAP